MTGQHEPTPEHASFPAHLAALIRQTVPPMHRAGLPFVAGGAAATLLLRRVFRPLGAFGAILTCFFAWFFREPRRVAPDRPGAVAASADGLVSGIGPAVPPPELGLGTEPMLRVSVFLSVFDVHVQRVPADATVTALHYHPGKFLSADLDKASEDNERNSMVLRTTDGAELVVVQIAGLLARRILCEVAEGQHVRAGETYGLIRFGSRVDTYLPADARVLVRDGQRTIGGETVLAELGVVR